MSALLLGPKECEVLAGLRGLAAARPVNMRGLMARLETPDGKAAHKAQMTEQSIVIPVGYCVTFSIETNHPGGTARHLSMSSPQQGRVPLPAAMWMVAQELGFTGEPGPDLFPQDCVVWLEDLEGHGKAVNLVQVMKPGEVAGSKARN